MKTKKNELKIASDSPVRKGRKPRKASVALSSEEAQDVMTKFFSKWDQKPVGGRMVLTNEVGQKWENPIWLEVDEVIRELDPGHFNSFACLSVRGNTYVQCLRGFNGWHLEWRITKPSGDFDHYRACRPGGSKKPMELKKSDWVSDGEHRDLLKWEDVIGAFYSFHLGEGLPSFLKWRKIDI
jgi:hypothetical protein